MCRRRFPVLLSLLVVSLASRAADAPVKKDAHGDPLPAGALARAGTVRWRPGSALTFLAFLPDGKTVVSAGVDGKIRFWERTTGREQRHLDIGPAPAPPGGRGLPRGGRFGFGFSSSIALAPNGKRLAWSADGGIRLWDVTANKELARVAETRGRVVSLAFAPGGKALAGLESDGTLRLWDDTGRLLRNWQIPGSDSGMRGRSGRGGRGGRGGPFFSSPLLFSPDGKTLLTVQNGFAGRGRDSRSPPRIHLWEVATGKLAREIKFGSEVAGIVSTVFAPDGKSLACGITDRETTGTSVRLLETSTGRVVKNLPGTSFSTTVTALLFLPNGKTLLGWSPFPHLITLWDIGAKGAKSVEVAGAVGFRSRVRPALSADGKRVVFPRASNVIGIVDLETGKLKIAPTGHDLAVTALAFADDGKTLLTGGTNQDGRRWDASSGRATGILPLFHAEVVVFAADGKSLARLGDDSLRVLDLAGAGRLRKELPLRDADSIASPSPPTANDWPC